MWFKNIQFYRFEDQFKLTAAQLHDKLETRKARPCGQMEMGCQGWSQPLGRAGHTLVHETDGALMICLRREDKLLPASLVREQVAERAFQIEQEAGRSVGRREKADIKDQVLQELLPRALVRAAHTWACILPQQGWRCIECGEGRGSDRDAAQDAGHAECRAAGDDRIAGIGHDALDHG
jgi:recombination associated protein RdgC